MLGTAGAQAYTPLLLKDAFFAFVAYILMFQVTSKAPPILATMARGIYQMLPDTFREGRRIVWQGSLQVAFYLSPLMHLLLVASDLLGRKIASSVAMSIFVRL